MGYFSELNLELHEQHNTPWNRDLWLKEKVAELEEILEDFIMFGEPELDVEEELFIYTDKDLFYMLPKDFKSIRDLERAIEICKSEISEVVIGENIDKNVESYFEDGLVLLVA